MLKFRLRPNRYVLAENYVQVVCRNKEYRDIAIDWLASNYEGHPVRTQAQLTLPSGEVISATAYYGQCTSITKGKLEVSEPKFMGVVFGVDEIIPEYATKMDVVFEVLHVSNDKSFIALKPVQPAFGCIWVIEKPTATKALKPVAHSALSVAKG